jgi:hypothetical protein
MIGLIKRIRGHKYLRHPGYHRKGCCTPGFLQELGHTKVAICTASIYGYALRKIIEATACGCRVLTDLPEDEVLPDIDGNLVRIHRNTGHKDVVKVIQRLLDEYNPERQANYAVMAKEFYDYRPMGVKLANDIESLRRSYEQVS